MCEGLEKEKRPTYRQSAEEEAQFKKRAEKGKEEIAKIRHP